MTAYQRALIHDHDRPPGEPARDALLRVEPSPGTGRVCLRLSGELHRSGTAQLTGVLAQLRHDGYRRVLVELSRLRYLSVGAAQVLADAVRAHAESGGRLRMLRPAGVVEHQLHLVGLRSLIDETPHPSRAPAAGGRRVTPHPAKGPFRMDPAQVSAALAGVAYPARRWQLLAEADYYGADVDTQVALARLPDGLYPDLASVIATVTAGLSAARSTTPSPRQ